MRRLKSIGILAFFLLISTILFFNTFLKGDFIFDDYENVLKNQNIKTFKDLIFLLDTDIKGLPLTEENPYFRPFSMLTLSLDYFLYKLKPAGYYMTNILLHGIISFFIFRIILMLIGNFSISFITALLFCFHPIASCIVPFISERFDLVMSVTSLLSIFFFLKFVNSASIQQLAFSCLFYFFALLSKENSIFILFLLILLGMLKKGKMIFRYLVPYCLILVFVFFSRKDFVVLIAQDIANFDIKKILYFFNILIEYLKIFVLPIHLSLSLRAAPPITILSVITNIIILFLIFLIFYFVLKNKKSRRIFIIGIGWFFIMNLPIFFIAGWWSDIGLMMGENWIYFSGIGLFLIMGYFLWHLRQRSLFVGNFVLAVLLISYVISNFFYSSIWRDEIKFYSHVLSVNPDNARARINLALAYEKNNDLDRALKEYRQVLMAQPFDWTVVTNIGNIYKSRQQYDDALIYYRRAIEYVLKEASASHNFKLAKIFNNMGEVYIRSGQADMAHKIWKNAIELNPEEFGPYFNLGLLCYRHNMLNDTVFCLKKALKIQPENIDSYIILGMSYLRLNQIDNALRIGKEALRIDPNNQIIKSIINKANSLRDRN